MRLKPRTEPSTVVLDDPNLLSELRERLSLVKRQEQELTQEKDALTGKQKDLQLEWDKIKRENERLDRISRSLEKRTLDVEAMRQVC